MDHKIKSKLMPQIILKGSQPGAWVVMLQCMACALGLWWAGWTILALIINGCALYTWLCLWKSNRLERMINGETKKAAANFSPSDWGAGPAPWE